MTIFRRPDYHSDIMQFIDQLKVAKPDLEAEQRKGRALLWDQSIDRNALKDQHSGQVAQKPYVYQSEPT